MVGLLTVGISGCKKDFLDLQVNPNTPSVTTPQFTLAGALKIAADIVNINYPHYGVWAGQLSPSGNYVPSPTLQQYQFTTDNFQVFAPLYSNLTNFDNLEKMGAADASLAKFRAIAKIMKAYDFEQLVDNYNDVPYTDAFKASTTFFPKYDKGADIYADLIKQIDAAIALIDANTSATNPDVSDIVFKGDMTKWKQFANTLKLRLSLRSGISATLPTAGSAYLTASVQAATQPGYANSDAVGGQQSPFWRSFGFDQNGNPTGNNAYYRANAFEVNLLNSFNDPRVSKFYAPITSGAIVGIIFGDATAIPNAGTSAIGSGLLKSAAQDGILLSSAESFFLQAEAVQNGKITGATAQSLYEQGITASFVAVGLTAANATTYYNQNIANVSWAASTDKERAIITQKWISLTGYGSLEAYNELRRTGFPAGVPRSIDSKAIGTGLPTRILYPTSEYQQNADNVGKEGTINPFGSKIFWAK